MKLWEEDLISHFRFFFQVLVGWYQAEDEEELKASLFDDLEIMRQHNTVRPHGSIYSVVPLIRDFIR